MAESTAPSAAPSLRSPRIGRERRRLPPWHRIERRHEPPRGARFRFGEWAIPTRSDQELIRGQRHRQAWTAGLCGLSVAALLLAVMSAWALFVTELAGSLSAKSLASAQSI